MCICFKHVTEVNGNSEMLQTVVLHACRPAQSYLSSCIHMAYMSDDEEMDLPLQRFQHPDDADDMDMNSDADSDREEEEVSSLLAQMPTQCACCSCVNC